MVSVCQQTPRKRGVFKSLSLEEQNKATAYKKSLNLVFFMSGKLTTKVHLLMFVEMTIVCFVIVIVFCIFARKNEDLMFKLAEEEITLGDEIQVMLLIQP